MGYDLFYRRPVSTGSDTASSGRPASMSNGIVPGGIPAQLSFDRIVSGQTCTPCSLREFMNYLLYIEHAAENLQFFLWYRDYARRFANLPASEKALAPLYVDEKFESDTAKHGPRLPDASKEKEEQTNGTVVAVTTANPFNESSRLTGTPTKAQAYNWDAQTMTSESSQRMDHHHIAAEAFASANITIQPFTIQPYREEITRIIATYIADGSPRQLNLAARERVVLLRALANTTHPSAFQQVAYTIETSLRHQAHPNFVRWTIYNGTAQRVSFARGLGVLIIIGGMVTAILLTLSAVNRGYRALAALPIIAGIMTLWLGVRGMCICLAMLHHRHVPAWELFEDPESPAELKKRSFDSFGSKNSYEDEPWVAREKRRGYFSRLFSKGVVVHDIALRRIHDTILLQAMGVGLVTAMVVTAIFVSLPAGRYY